MVIQSERGQVLDGLVRYGDQAVIVLESKLGPASDWQAGNINLYGQPIEFDNRIRRISWHSVLATFTDFADEKRGLVTGAERIILTDFLDFVDRNFWYLGPFNTLRRCEAEPSRIRRRLGVILSEILGSNDEHLPGNHFSVTLARLTYNEDKRDIMLEMWPADTLQQARVFYKKPKASDRLLMLASKGWRVRPNFHFGFMALGLCWTTSTLSTEDYLAYWRSNIDNVVQINRQDWNRYWQELVSAKIAKAVERENFDKDFTNTQRSTAVPRPGVECAVAWSLDEAEHLDSSGRLTAAIKERINQVLVALGEEVIG
jgi:hypothetical protein